MNPVETATAYVRDWLNGFSPEVAIVLGSGLGGLAATVEQPRRLSYSGIPGFPVSTVAGHSGELVCGRIDRTAVVLQSGRFHLYEGHDPGLSALPVRVFAELGVRVLVLTNAAGGMRAGMRPPLLMLLSDQINLTNRNPLTGPALRGEERFPDMSEPYDVALRQLAREAALHEGIHLEEGVYAGLLGPSYETPAEIRMLRRFGADAVGMSTVAEVVAGRARGMRVLGISCITNPAAGTTPHKLSHDEVLRAGQQVEKDLERLVRGLLARLPAG